MDSDSDLRNSLIEEVTLSKDLKELRELTVYSGRREFQTETSKHKGPKRMPSKV